MSSEGSGMQFVPVELPVTLQLTREGLKPTKECTEPEEDSPKTRPAWAIRRGKFVCDKEIWQTVTARDMGDITSPAKKRRKVRSRKPQAPAVQPGSPSQVPLHHQPSSVPSTGDAPSGCPDRTKPVRSVLYGHVSGCAGGGPRRIEPE